MNSLSIQSRAQALLQAQQLGQRLSEGFNVIEAQGRRTIERTPAYNTEQAERVASVFIEHLTRTDAPSTALANCARTFLNVEIIRHQTELDKGLKPNEKNSHFMQLGLLDRILSAISFRQNREAAPFQTKISRDLFTKWQRSQETFSAKKAALKNQPLAPGQLGSVLSLADAEKAFRAHPEQVNFVLQNHLHKQAGRYDEAFQLDAQDNILIKFHGQYTPVPLIMQQVQMINGKLCNLAAQRVIYRQNTGLTEFDPSSWVTLPVFRTKARKTQDYRVDVRTVLQNNAKHMWLELKDPQGNIYNVGYFFKNEEFNQPMSGLAQTIQGRLIAGDLHEFMYPGELENTLRTSYVLNETQFTQLKANIEAFQAVSVKSYNLLNHNCASWSREMLGSIGIHLNTQMTLSEIGLGTAPFQWIFDIPILGLFFYAVYWVLSVLRNLLLCAIGGTKVNPEEDSDAVTVEALRRNRMFRNVQDVLDPERGLIDHPMGYREFQKQQGKQKIDCTQIGIPVA